MVEPGYKAIAGDSSVQVHTWETMVVLSQQSIVTTKQRINSQEPVVAQGFLLSSLFVKEKSLETSDLCPWSKFIVFSC